MKTFVRYFVALLVVGLIVFQSATVSLSQGQALVITHFGKPDRIVREPGLHFKWPWPVDETYHFDTRMRLSNTRYTQTLTRDKRAIILMTYLVWNIQDPLLFLQTVGDLANAEGKLDGLVTNAKNNILGSYDLSAILSTEEDKIMVDRIEQQIFDSISDKASREFGVTIRQLGIKRIAFPENNVRAIFSQMQAERDQFASKYRAQGKMEASIIMSDTELEKEKIKAAAQQEAEEIKGRADREAAEIYAAAHSRGKAFYQMKRSLEALEKIADQNTVLIMRSDQPPFSSLFDKAGEPAKNED